jgi:cellulose synthase/poly-beta-1,6-N-acetylglucosamine synthase-like glycosyltransferase
MFNPMVKEDSSPFIIFQICSKNAPPIVHDVIARIRAVCEKLRFSNYRIDLVVDNLPPQEKFDANIVLVPKSYKPPNGCKTKPRALQYAVERRKINGEISKDIWIFLLDEESFITEQTLKSLLHYLAQPNPPPIAEGPIIYPNKFFEANLLCSFAECMRPYICYDCVTQMTSGKGPIHMHGSNLLVRSDIEAQVGWDFPGVEASEDQRFGWEAYNLLGGKVFGWHGGMLEEQPPLTIKDLIKQRRRWFMGNIHNIKWANIPQKKKVYVALRWITWGIGFLAGVLSFPSFFFSIIFWFIPQKIPYYFQIPLILNTLIWIIPYQIGLKLNLETLKISTKKRVALHFILLILTPVVGLIETYAVFTAPFFVKRFVREPTPK